MGIFFQKLKQLIFHPSSLLFIFFPIAATIFFGFLFEKQQEELVVPIAIIDEDKTDVSEKIIAEIQKERRIVVHHASIEQAKRLLLRNEVDSVFYIKKQFKERLSNEKWGETIELWTSPSSVATGVVKELVASKIARMTTAIKASNRVVELTEKKLGKLSNSKQLWEEAYEYNDQQWEPDPLMTIDFAQGENNVGKKKVEKTATTSYIGLWSFFTMLASFYISDWIVKEKNHIFPRVKTMSNGLIYYLLQRTGAIFFLHLFQIVIIYSLFAYYQLEQVSISLFLLMIIYLIFCLSLSVGLASLFSHLGSYYLMGLILAFLIGILGGSFFSIGELAHWLRNVSSWMPQQLFRNDGLLSEFKVSLLMLASLFLWVFAIWRLKRIR